MQVHSLLMSSLCTQAQLESADFRGWAERMREPFRWHRKLWEHCYIAQALSERGLLRSGTRGLGFAVGQEPLAALFAGMGCEIVASDTDCDMATRQGWASTGQHAAGLDALNQRGLCPAHEFGKRTTFRVVDMNAIPVDLQGFDFCWSACAFEHLGTIANGQRFIRNMLRCLKPGGVAVHTTEFNLSSNTETRDHDEEFVLFRRRDIEEIARDMTAAGHSMELNFEPGDGEKDRYVDPEPFTRPNRTVHLRLKIEPFVATSIGLIIRKAGTSFASDRI